MTSEEFPTQCMREKETLVAYSLFFLKKNLIIFSGITTKKRNIDIRSKDPKLTYKSHKTCLKIGQDADLV